MSGMTSRRASSLRSGSSVHSTPAGFSQQFWGMKSSSCLARSMASSSLSAIRSTLAALLPCETRPEPASSDSISPPSHKKPVFSFMIRKSDSTGTWARGPVQGPRTRAICGMTPGIQAVVPDQPGQAVQPDEAPCEADPGARRIEDADNGHAAPARPSAPVRQSSRCPGRRWTRT